MNRYHITLLSALNVALLSSCTPETSEQPVSDAGAQTTPRTAEATLETTMPVEDRTQVVLDSAPLEGPTEAGPIPEPESDGFRHIMWEHLVPSDFSFESLYDSIEAEDLSELPDDSPKVQAQFQRFAQALAQAPVVDPIMGKDVRLPGFVVPLDSDGEKVYSFLLVPYMGACIHTPPPPANQIIYIETEEGYQQTAAWDPVYVFGTLTQQRQDTDLGSAGYSLILKKITPYTG